MNFIVETIAVRRYPLAMPARPRQQSFAPSFGFGRSRSRHGGETARGRRKLARPIDPKRPLHVILKSTKARGDWSMLRGRCKQEIDELVRELAEECGIRLYRQANVGNHLHLLVQVRNRPNFQSFLRKLAGRIAFLVTGCAKGRALSQQGAARGERGFWDHLAFTRIVSWGKDWDGMNDYLIVNLLEASGAKRGPGARLQTVKGEKPPPDWKGWDHELDLAFRGTP